MTAPRAYTPKIEPILLSGSERLALMIYSMAWSIATPVVMVYLLWRARRQPAYREHWGERWAWRWHHAPRLLPANKPPEETAGPAFGAANRPLWIHAVSVGETRAAQSLIEALLVRDPTLSILLTHMTPTGRAVGEALFVQRWPQRIRQAYLPYDQGWAIERFLTHWQPRAGLIMETELWPNLCFHARRRGVPLALVSARLSARSLRKGLRRHRLVVPALRSLSMVLAQTQADATRLRQLGTESVRVVGNLKFDLIPSQTGLALGAGWRGALGGRGIVLAASTRDGEEALLLEAWREALATESAGPPALTTDSAAALGQQPHAPPAGAHFEQRPQLLIVPRHPQRFETVANEIRRAGFTLARRTGDWPAQAVDADVLLGDSMGEMAAYYALADVAIIGGSLLPFGAQNLIEACAQGVPVIVGPHYFNFEQAAQQAIEAGAACLVTDAPAAVSQALAVLADAPRRSAMAQAGLAFSSAHRGATGRTLAALAPWID